MKNYYEVLQIPENAGREDIQKSYRRLAKLYHPDINKSPDAHEKFCGITEAYEFLMHHWPQRAAQYTSQTTTQQKHDEYRKTEAYEMFRQEAREKARKQAEMRYEKFKKQHEAFNESGINDIALLFTMIARVAGILVLLGSMLLPVILAIFYAWTFIFLALFAWPLGWFIGRYIFDNRKGYIMPWKFYYTPNRIKQLYTEKHPTIQSCYYCQNRTANSKPYKLDLFKLKDVKVKTYGYRQHNVNYINQELSIGIPRSQRAFIIHTLSSLLKILSIVLCIIYIPVSSIVWRLILGMILGGTISTFVLVFSRTKSNTSYLVSYTMLTRVIIWLICISLVSQFNKNTWDISTNDSIYIVLAAIIIFDSFLMQVIGFLMGKQASLPVSDQYPEAAARFTEGYVVYNDIPILSVVYPIFKWIFG